ncbi:PAAR domain-containing protein [Sorangium sp. So ce291]|uniref:PAAR domain-containing protein n=1 Tax=Sorangium sp. So ce291 TaxID=3133294 RepID=UPI003F63BDE8
MPAAARISDAHTCPKVEPGPIPHVGGPVSTGETTVLIGFMPTARAGDTAVCIGPPDAIKDGEPTVLIGNKPAARIGDSTTHGGIIISGCPSVNIGSSAQAEALRTNKPFCEECEAKKQKRETQRRKNPR